MQNGRVVSKIFSSIKCPASPRWELSWEITDNMCHIYIYITNASSAACTLFHIYGSIPKKLCCVLLWFSVAFYFTHFIHTKLTGKQEIMQLSQ